MALSNREDLAPPSCRELETGRMPQSRDIPRFLPVGRLRGSSRDHRIPLPGRILVVMSSYDTLSDHCFDLLFGRRNLQRSCVVVHCTSVMVVIGMLCMMYLVQQLLHLKHIDNREEPYEQEHQR